MIILRHFILISLISAIFPLYKTIGKICFGLHNYPCLSQNTAWTIQFCHIHVIYRWKDSSITYFFFYAHLHIETQLFCFYQNFISSAVQRFQKALQTTNKQRTNNEQQTNTTNDHKTTSGFSESWRGIMIVHVNRSSFVRSLVVRSFDVTLFLPPPYDFSERLKIWNFGKNKKVASR